MQSVPLRATRLTAIDAMLRVDGAVRTADVARRFGVSEMTARRDLTALAADEAYLRVHGGLVLASRLRAAPG